MTTTNYNLVYLDNKIIEASFSLSIVEKRILWIILSRIDQREEILPTTAYQMDFREYAELCQVELKHVVEELPIAAEKLFDRHLLVKTSEDKYDKLRWIYFLHVDKKEGISVKFSPDLIPYISELKNRFTKLKLINGLEITSSYTWRIYDLLLSQKFKGIQGKLELELKDLIFILQVPECYHEYRRFKEKILNPSIKELREREFALIELKERRTGRFVTSIILNYVIENPFKKDEGKRAKDRINKLNP